MTLLQLLSDNEKKIRSIVLTKEQEAEAYFEGQKKVFFHERNKHYWITEDCDTKTIGYEQEKTVIRQD